MSPIWQHLRRCRGVHVRVDATRSYALSGFVARFHGSVLARIDASRVRDGAVASTDYEENDDMPTAPSEKVQKIVEDIAGLTLVEVADMSALLKKKLRIQNVPVMPMGMNVMPDMWYEAPIPPQLSSRRGPGIFPFDKEEVEPAHLLRSRKPPLDLGQQRDMPGINETKTAANEAAVPLHSEVLATVQMKEKKVSFELPSTSDEGEDDDEDYESEDKDDEFLDDDDDVEVPALVGKQSLMEFAKPVGKNKSGKVAAAPPMQVEEPKAAVGKKKSKEPEKPMPVMKKKKGKSVEVEHPEPEVILQKKNVKAAPAMDMKGGGNKKHVKNRVAPVVESEPEPESAPESELESEPELEPEPEPEPAKFGNARPRLKSNGRFVSAAEYEERVVNPVPMNNARNASPAAKKGAKDQLTAPVSLTKPDLVRNRKSGAVPTLKEEAASKRRPVAKQEAPALPATKKTVAAKQSGKTASKTKC